MSNSFGAWLERNRTDITGWYVMFHKGDVWVTGRVAGIREAGLLGCVRLITSEPITEHIVPGDEVNWHRLSEETHVVISHERLMMPASSSTHDFPEGSILANPPTGSASPIVFFPVGAADR